MSNLISLKNDNNINIVNKIYEYNTPEYIYIEIKDEEYKIDDYIYKNIIINKSISSISGIVSDIEKINNKNYLVIKNDFKENSVSKNKKEKINNYEELINCLGKYKLEEIEKKIKKIKKINNIVISGIDEEIYSKSEFSILSKNVKEILDTMEVLLNIFSIDNSLIAIKNTNFNGIKSVKSILGAYPNIDIVLTPDKYLISKKDFLCKYLNIKEEDTLVFSTNEIYEIYNMLNGKYNTEKLITISGNAIKKSIVINTKLGVKLSDLINEQIKIIDNNYEIYINGYLSGIKISSIDKLIIDKSIHTIVINKIEEKKVLECINCGACNKICPYNINIKLCYIKNIKSKKCSGCGLCNYICPSNIDLRNIVKEK